LENRKVESKAQLGKRFSIATTFALSVPVCMGPFPRSSVVHLVNDYLRLMNLRLLKFVV